MLFCGIFGCLFPGVTSQVCMHWTGHSSPLSPRDPSTLCINTLCLKPVKPYIFFNPTAKQRKEGYRLRPPYKRHKGKGPHKMHPQARRRATVKPYIFVSPRAVIPLRPSGAPSPPSRVLPPVLTIQDYQGGDGGHLGPSTPGYVQDRTRCFLPDT